VILDGNTVMTVSFTEDKGKTTLVSRVVYQTTKELEAMKSRGMVEGTCETWDMLAHLVEGVSHA